MESPLPHPHDSEAGSDSVRLARCVRFGTQTAEGPFADVSLDRVVVEEPLELRVGDFALATIMRTPGHDRDLALGFLYGEGVIDRLDDVGALAFCARDNDPGGAGRQSLRNVARLVLADSARAPRLMQRHGPALSSCGVCGKRTIDEALELRPPAGVRVPELEDDGGRARAWIDAARLAELPARLRHEQRVFDSTGALHAAGLFDEHGRALWIREDIGRHNAVDKVVGAAILAGALPLRHTILQVSGRVSFEIVQKAFRGGIPLVAAVSGVSSLAIDLAARVGMTLVGFSRDGRFNVYAGASDVRGLGGPAR